MAVYRAQQASLDRPVALKVLLARGPGRERDVERFVREAKAIARLPHPNIVTIHDVITRGTLRVIVMEYLGGGSLADLLEGGALTPDATLRVGEAVARALAYAHAHEVVHRNVKPSNVLYAPEMEAYKLGDFGLATGPGQARAGDTSFIDLPLEGLAFVPPELLEERPGADPRADVYALGATLYACAAGAPPFTGRTAVEVATRILRDDPPPLEGAAAPLWPLVRRAMAKVPADRHVDGAALLHEVRACQAMLARAGAPPRAPQAPSRSRA
ncbi:MAG: serine/threonine protein kinase [Planctomycetes bacterium]|nr:serine/threonine protein kinase [Planctomycetota bacterium]